MTPTKPGVEKTPPAVEPMVEPVVVPKVELVEPAESTPAEPEHDLEFWKAKASAIDAENKKALKRLAALEAKEKERTDAELTELEKAKKEVADLKAKVAAGERRELQRKVAEKVKLPLVFADRIQGETEAEMEIDAAALLAAMPAKVAPPLNPTNPGQPQTGETDADRRERLGLPVRRK